MKSKIQISTRYNVTLQYVRYSLQLILKQNKKYTKSAMHVFVLSKYLAIDVMITRCTM